MQDNLFGFRRQPHRLNRGIYHFDEIYLLDIMKLQPARDDAAHFKKIFNELPLDACIVLDDFQAFSHILLLHLSILEELRPSQNGVQWGP